MPGGYGVNSTPGDVPGGQITDIHPFDLTMRHTPHASAGVMAGMIGPGTYRANGFGDV